MKRKKENIATPPPRFRGFGRRMVKSLARHGWLPAAIEHPPRQFDLLTEEFHSDPRAWRKVAA